MDFRTEDSWIEDVDNIRKIADAAQAKANEKMVAYLSKKNKISSYSIRENVLVQNPMCRTKHGKRILDKVPAFKGRILENSNGLRYRVQYETDECASFTDWFSVNQITSITKEKENDRKKECFHTKESNKCNISPSFPPEMNTPMLNLRERLESWDLVPEETEKDGNCFFRAVSRMVYGSDQYHHYIRQRAVETLSLSIEEYQPFFLHEYDSPEAYLAHMRQDNSWADDAAVRATVEALEIEIQIISAENDYIPILTPSNTVPSQTIFIGLVQDFHFVSTSDRSQPQYVQQGGVTSDGIILEYTECVDNPFTWLLELFTKSNQLFDKRLETLPCSRLRILMSRLRSGNSADGKKELAEWIRRKKYVYQTEKISFKSNTDKEIIEKILRNSKLNDLEWQVTYNACPNEECECGTSLQRHSFSRLTLKDMENMKKNIFKVLSKLPKMSYRTM